MIFNGPGVKALVITEPGDQLTVPLHVNSV
jgi:hypothetical protein